jgi:hypothetical protein
MIPVGKYATGYQTIVSRVAAIPWMRSNPLAAI